MTNLLRNLACDATGAIAVEFALIGPALLMMILGVVQGGVALQQYNALRGVSADVARYAMVQYQTGNDLTNSQLRTYTRNYASGTPYLLDSERFEATVTDAATQRVTGATEKTLKVTYQMDSVLEYAKIEGPYVTYSRPIFLVND